MGKDFYAINMSYSENTKVMYIESLYFKPFGANGTRTEKSGYQGCSPDIGSVTDPNGSSNALYGASGAGCSYKYLYEK